MLRVTVTPYGSFSIGDFVGNEPYQLDHQFVSMSFSATDDPTSFYCTQQQYDSGIRKALEKIACQRVRIAGTRQSKPMMVYECIEAPEEVPRVHQVEGGALSVGGGAQTLVLRGQNLIAGRRATATVGSGTGLLTFTAARKGPSGERVTINILKAGSAGVAIVRGTDDAGQPLVTINVTPSSGGGGTQANTIAAQFSGAVTQYVTAAAGGTGLVKVTSDIKLTLGGLHGGAGVAYLDVPSALTRTVLRIESFRPGSKGNGWALSISDASGGGSVTVNTTLRTVALVPATGAGNTDASVLRDQLNANATFAKWLVASVIGTDGDDVPKMARNYLYGGSDNEPTAQIGGVDADVIAYSDTAVSVRVTGAALSGGGCAAGETAIVNLILGDRCLAIPVDITA